MSSPAANIATLLNATSGINTGFPISVSRMPETPDAGIAVSDSGGMPPDPKFALDYKGVQVLVRGNPNGYSAAYAKASAIKAALISLAAGAVGDMNVIGSFMRGEIGQLGYDESNRPLLSLNFLFYVQSAEAGPRTNL